MQAVVSIPHPLFFVSVADKGVSVAVSGLESTVTGCRVSVDSSRLRRAKVQRSKRVCRLLGGGSCGRSEGRRCFCLGQVAEWMCRSAGGCWTERGLELEREQRLEKRKKKQVPHPHSQEARLGSG